MHHVNYKNVKICNYHCFTDDHDSYWEIKCLFRSILLCELGREWGWCNWCISFLFFWRCWHILKHICLAQVLCSNELGKFWLGPKRWVSTYDLLVSSLLGCCSSAYFTGRPHLDLHCWWRTLTVAFFFPWTRWIMITYLRFLGFVVVLTC